MKKVIIFLLSLIVMNLSFSMSDTQAKTKFTLHTYNHNKHVQYYSISGEKYKAVNSKMKSKAKYINKRDIENRETAAYSPYNESFYDTLKPSVKYHSSKRISILAREHWYAGGEMDYIYHSYNLVNGKQITLKSTFKSKTAYKKANKQVSNYLRKKLNYGANINENDRVTYSGKLVLDEADAFYWTKKGLYVVYDTGTIAPVAAQQQIVHVSNKYAKYY